MKEKMGLSNLTLTNKEFYKQAARWADVTNINTVVKYWEAFVEVIVREVYYNGSCKLPSVGTITTKTLPKTTQHQIDKNGKEHFYEVPARVLPVFTPEDDFINDINMQGVTKTYRRRLNQGQLSKRDYIRKARYEDMSTKVTEEMVEDSKSKFQELLKEKISNVKGKVEKYDEED